MENMHKRKALVSICIPTYNRCKYLENCIESIITQAEFLNGMVEINVSDNYSDDDTEELCRKYANKYDNFRYQRNDKTVGADLNQAIATKMAKGDLIKLSNDSLVYQKNSMKVICSMAEKYNEHRPFVFFTNGNECCKGAYSSKEYVDGEGEVYNCEDFILNIGYWITFIGSYSFWRDDYNRYTDSTEGFETNLRQVILACEILSDKNKAIIVSDSIFINQPVHGKNVSYGLFRVFYNNYMDILMDYSEKGMLSKKCIDYLRTDILLNFFPSWVVRWEYNKDEVNFSKNENLKKLVIDECRRNNCYRDYYSNYKQIRNSVIKEKIKAGIINIINRRR